MNCKSVLFTYILKNDVLILKILHYCYVGLMKPSILGEVTFPRSFFTAKVTAIQTIIRSEATYYFCGGFAEIIDVATSSNVNGYANGNVSTYKNVTS